MGTETTRLLEAFEALPAEEQRILAQELLRRALPFDSGAIEDDEIALASDSLFRSVADEEDAADSR
ncbi:MAG: hypothetical protein FJW34_26930 [Acidobacteria bacterium]|nr:hypothetical protein [Acidobacteriota bacterium]